MAARDHVAQWDDEVDFEKKVGRLCELSHESKSYHYNARKVPPSELQDVMTVHAWTKDVDIIVRPTDLAGKVLLLHAVSQLSRFPFLFLFLGWEFHAYLVQKRATGFTLYEPTDDVVLDLASASAVFASVKTAYYVTARPKRKVGVKSKVRETAVYMPVEKTAMTSP